MRKFRNKEPFNCPNNNPVVRRFYELAFEQRMTLADISERSGMNKNTMHNWRYISTPRVSDINAALNVLGYEVTVRRIKK
jgi:transcriptional regulator with XRE-family HTH domain